MAPYIDALWTPPYWEFYAGHYRWHHGYWGRHVGFYGGINYGFGYTGLGFYGGYWSGGSFVYNRSVTNVNVNVVHNVYERRITNHTPFNRVSYNGGSGGIARRPTAPELAAVREARISPMPAQVQQAREASANRAQFAAANHGRPSITAEVRPLAGHPNAPHASATPESRPVPQNHSQAAPMERPEVRPMPPQTAQQIPRMPVERPAAPEIRRPVPPAPPFAREVKPSPMPQRPEPPRQAGREGVAAGRTAPPFRPEVHPAPVAPQADREGVPNRRPSPPPHPEVHPAPAMAPRPAPPAQHEPDRGRGREGHN